MPIRNKRALNTICERLAVTMWLFKQRLSLSAQRCPMWEKPLLQAHNNGGRHANECFSCGAEIGYLALSLTLWRIGGWSRILKFLP